LLAGVTRGVGRAADTAPAVAWDRLQGLLTQLIAANEDEAAGRLGRAWSEFGVLADATDASALRAVGEAGRRRLSQAARSALVESRELAATDSSAATRALRAAAVRFESTPFADDFSATLRAFEAAERFPRLEESHR
jgi:hypothetical protein